MKKLVVTLSVAMIICVMAFSLTACGGKVDANYDNGIVPVADCTVVDGKSAIDTYAEVMANLFELENYAYIADLQFEALGGIARQHYYDKVKVMGGKTGTVFFENAKFGTGQGKACDGKRFYFDGEYGNVLTFTDDASRLPAKTVTDALVPDFKGLDYSDWDDTKEDYTAAVRAERYRSNLTSYPISKAKLSTTNHNDKVYKKGDKTYFTITLKCMANEADKDFATVIEELEDATGGKNLVWDQDTHFSFECAEIDGVLLPSSWTLVANFTGKKGIKVPCSQKFTFNHTYGEADYTITDNEKTNK
ncbi:MAG: hypothetical protein RRY78_02350 [Clostridia bacterium]